MKKHLILFAILIVSNLTFQSFGQVGLKNLRFHTFSPSGGFYYDGISSLKQDNVGFIWLVMPNEVFRFDGYQYKRYHSRFNKTEKSDKIIFRSVEKDAEGRIYIITNKGLYLYNRETDLFECIFDNDVSGAKFDKKGNLWLFSDRLIGSFSLKNKLFASIISKESTLVSKAICTRENDLLIGTKTGEVFSYNYGSKTLKLFHKFPSNYSIIDIKYNELVWILTENKGLYKLNSLNGTIENEYHSFRAKNNEYVPAKTLYLDKNKNIWVGTQRGLYILKSDGSEFAQYIHSENDEFTLPNSSVWTIQEDNLRNIWIGTYSGGLSYVNFQGNSRFVSHYSQVNNLNHNVVSSFVEDNAFIWIGTEGGGLNRLDKKTGNISYYKHNSEKNSISYDNVKSLVLDHHNNLWIGLFMTGIDKLNIGSNVFENYRNEQLTNTRRIVLEADSGLWIANQSNTIFSFYSFQQKIFSNYSLKYMLDGVISDICRGLGCDLWVASDGHLCKMDVKSLKNSEVLPHLFSSIRIETICVDKLGNVWIGTIDSGLLKYNDKKKTLYRYKDILKFGVSAIYSICIDNYGNPWMGTDDGLFKFDVIREQFLHFDKIDGVQGSVFCPKSCLKGMNGELYFGGTNGFSIVHPDKVSLNHFKAQTIITDFYIDNKIVTPNTKQSPIEKSIDITKEITLNHNFENFGFRFSSNNYFIPEKNRFKYRLKGYDEDWIEVDATNRIASYSKVPPGEYKFEVLAANNDGVWSTVPTVIKIKRLPAPLESWWAYLIYAILSVTIVYLVIRYYIYQKKLKLELHIESLEMQRKEDMHQSQLRFFTNVSHEFRTPLFLMTAALDKFKSEGIKGSYFQLFTRNTQRLLNLINELMDFKMIEDEKMSLKVTLANINEFIKNISIDFKEYAVLNEIKFDIICDPDLDQMFYFDQQLVEKIVLNLLNNAFKFTDKGGSISIETYFDAVKFKGKYKYSFQEGVRIDANQFCIVVRDTGVGISKESISNVFSRFYKAGTSDNKKHMGSGIGLALVKGIVLIHKGSIVIFSERDKGSEFQVAFSRNPDIYNESDFVNEEPQVFEKKHGGLNINFQQDSINEFDLEMDNFIPQFRENKRVLLVEDNDEVRAIIREAISQYFEITEAANGIEALELLKTYEIDLIISDLMMPLKDGIALCKEVKEDVNTSHIPFIMLTAKSGTENRIEGMNTGADVYFEKPVNLKLLLLSIQNIFIRQNSLKEFYAKNYYVDSTELTTNQQDNLFMTQLVNIIESHLDESEIDVNFIASQLSMNRTKLYNKIKSMTDKTIVEFVRTYRLRKAARMLVEDNLPINEVMIKVGIESNSFFTRAFKVEFGMTPSAFVKKAHQK